MYNSQYDPKKELKSAMESRAVLRGDYELSSGEKSDIYIDTRTLILDSYYLRLISSFFKDQLRQMEKHSPIEVIGCTESLGAMVLLGYLMSTNDSIASFSAIDGFVVRKQRKTYGTKKRIESSFNIVGASNSVMIEDVITTGDTVTRAIEEAKKIGIKVRRVFCILDRGENTEEKLKEKGCDLYSIFKLSDFT